MKELDKRLFHPYQTCWNATFDLVLLITKLLKEMKTSEVNSEYFSLNDRMVELKTHWIRHT